MNAFVTGASGFIGSNLVHELVAQGHRVKALLRPGSDERGLAGVEFERVTGDVFDRKLLEREMEGCDWCFHVAASYHLWLRDYKPMYAVNVEGTRNVLEAAGKAGCQRIVYTSTVGCVGLPKMVDGRLVPSTELDAISNEQLTNHYKRSKWQAECLAMKLVHNGLPIVIVNPTAPVGPRDVKPTPTGQVIVDFLNRKLPAYLDTGLNWVHVRDVAAGHILAAEKGEIGERYILGNQEGNWTMRETLAVLEEIPAFPRQKLKSHIGLRWRRRTSTKCAAFFTGKPPRTPLAGVRMARYKMWFNPAKAIRVFKLPQTPPKQALADAVEWFRANGYVKS